MQSYYRNQWQRERRDKHRFEERRQKMTDEERREFDARLLGRGSGTTDVSHLTGETGGPGPKPGEEGYVEMPPILGLTDGA